jgi:hypothetical protein
VNEEKALANLEAVKQAIISGRPLLYTTITGIRQSSGLVEELAHHTYSLAPQTITRWAVVTKHGDFLACYTNKEDAERVAVSALGRQVVELKGEF